MTIYSNVQTEELIKMMVVSGLLVPQDLAEEITKRHDAVPYLIDIINTDEYSEHDGPGDGWTPIHATFLLSTFNTPEVIPPIINLLKEQGEHMGDWLTEDMSAILVNLGIPAVEPLKKLVSDEKIYVFSRCAASSALTILAHHHPEIRGSVIDIFRQIIRHEDGDIVYLLMHDLAQFKDDDALEDIKTAFESGKVYEDFLTMDDIESIYSTPDDKLDYHRDERKPMDHFFPEHLGQLWEVNYGSKNSRQLTELKKGKKIGRNEPCPCGSGKKYKKCCLKTENSITS